MQLETAEKLNMKFGWTNEKRHVELYETMNVLVCCTVKNK